MKKIQFVSNCIDKNNYFPSLFFIKEEFSLSLALTRKVRSPSKLNYLLRRFVSLVLSLRDYEEQRGRRSYEGSGREFEARFEWTTG